MSTNNITWNFKDKTCLIVGGSRGIGKAIVNDFIKAKANVISIDSSNCDISKPKEIDVFFNNLNCNIDILVNVAAINFCKKIESISLEEWDDVLNVNLRGIFYVIKRALEKIPKGGRIVNVSSIAGRNRSLVSGVHYTSSKAAIIGLTRQLAFELGPKSINVNAVCPSQTLTEMLQQSMSEQQIKDLSNSIPLKRIALVREQVNPILFLCSAEASYITGAVLDVNGGQL